MSNDFTVRLHGLTLEQRQAIVAMPEFSAGAHSDIFLERNNALERIAELEAQLEAVGAGGVASRMANCQPPSRLAALRAGGWMICTGLVGRNSRSNNAEITGLSG